MGKSVVMIPRGVLRGIGGKGGISPVPGADLNVGETAVLPCRLLPMEDLLPRRRLGDRKPALVARILVFLAILILLDRRLLESLKEVGGLGSGEFSEATLSLRSSYSWATSCA